jgi:hypothetical protein
MVMMKRILGPCGTKVPAKMLALQTLKLVFTEVIKSVKLEA